MLTLHMRPNSVVVCRELIEQVVQMLLAEDDKLRQALKFDRLYETLAASIQIWAGFR